MAGAAHMTKEMWHRDHPLSEEGLRQSERLRQQIAEARAEYESMNNVWECTDEDGQGSPSGSCTQSKSERVYYERFLSEQRPIYCSPMLRALQTAHLVFSEDV